MPERLCCDINQGIVGGTECDPLIGGIEDVRIGCYKYFAFSENDCADGPDAAVVTAATATDPDTGADVIPLYTVDIRKKSGSHAFNLSYDKETNTVTRTGTVSFEIVPKDPQAFCAFEKYIGQEVVVFFKFRGTDRWFVEGRGGDLWVTEIDGGTGTDANQNTVFTITGDDLTVLVKEFYVGDADLTEAAVDALTN